MEKERNTPTESWLEKAKYEIEHEPELLTKQAYELGKIRGRKEAIDKFFKWIEHWDENGGFGYEGWDAGWEEDLRKFMGED